MKLADGFGGSNPPDATFFKELNVSITHSLQYGILHLTIDRVERRNALTAEMFADLADELDQAIMQTAVRVVLLKSSGTVFSAGADLEEMFSAPEDLERETRRFFDSIAKFPKPIIAQVSGPCVGEAFAALLYCDLVYVSPQALFSLLPSLWHVRLAMVPHRLWPLPPVIRPLPKSSFFPSRSAQMKHKPCG